MKFRALDKALNQFGRRGNQRRNTTGRTASTVGQNEETKMKKLLSLSAVALAAVATPALAAPSSVDVSVSAQLAKACAFNGGVSDTSMTLGNDQRYDSGVVAYSCNYIGTPVVTIVSLNGALAPDAASATAGAVPVPYQVRYGDSAAANSGDDGLFASQFTGGGINSTSDVNGWTSTTVPNQLVSPLLAIYLTNPIAIAGNYSDTLTFSIAP